MARFDITGLFWDDYVAPKVPVVKEKRQPPEPVWLAPDYLPHWNEASVWQVPEMTDAEVMALAGRKLPWDTEFYRNYALVGFQDPDTGRVASFERHEGWHGWTHSLDKLAWIARNTVPIGFNSIRFDVPMLHACLAGRPVELLCEDADVLINGLPDMPSFGAERGLRPWRFYRARKVPEHFSLDHIDVWNLTPLGPSLKVCAGRLSAHRMADLPFVPGTALSPEQKVVLRWYWYNDLANTRALWQSHSAAIELRELMTAEYGVDVRSKSDPQIAEEVISTEIRRMTGKDHIARATIVPGRQFMYRPPEYLQYQTPLMRWVLDIVRRQVFTLDAVGQVDMPKELDELEVPIAGSVYTMGIGGLHSQENRVKHVAGDTHEIMDSDVTSYYPSLMIQQGMYPPNVGPEFIIVFKRIVDRRVAAKAAGDKGTAETLKIVANGTFGKTGERNGGSVVYYPEMMIQVTLSGQLSLLMLVERLELAGISVISANTDGIITKCPLGLREARDVIMKQWERETGLVLEHKRYRAVYARDVNSYVAIYEKPDTKAKGAFQYAKTVGEYRQRLDVYPLKWNPNCEVCTEAMIMHLATGADIESHVRGETDFRKFVQAQKITGGACKDGEYLGKAIRWYYSSECPGPIVNAATGGRVANSDGGRPCMVLPEAIPPDLDYTYYVERATAMLADFEPKLTAAEKKAIASAVA